MVENDLLHDGRFHLPGKKALLSEKNAGRTLAVDITESRMEHPNKQKPWYSDKKKYHTIKTQIIADVETQEILCTAQEKGGIHDICSRQRTVWGMLLLLLADSGYQGLLSLHKNRQIPYKRSKNYPLTAQRKAFNRALSKEQIVIENINARIKTFKIMSKKYRNRRKRHLLKMNLIGAILK